MKSRMCAVIFGRRQFGDGTRQTAGDAVRMVGACARKKQNKTVDGMAPTREPFEKCNRTVHAANWPHRAFSHY